MFHTSGSRCVGWIMWTGSSPWMQRADADEFHSGPATFMTPSDAIESERGLGRNKRTSGHLQAEKYRSSSCLSSLCDDDH